MSNDQKEALDEIQRLSAELEEEKRDIQTRVAEYHTKRLRLKKLVLRFGSGQETQHVLPLAEVGALAGIQQTGKRDYGTITKALFGEDTPAARKEAYKVFARWREVGLVWREDDRWCVSDEVFKMADDGLPEANVEDEDDE